jgi:hypothetical protein
MEHGVSGSSSTGSTKLTSFSLICSSCRSEALDILVLVSLERPLNPVASRITGDAEARLSRANRTDICFMMTVLQARFEENKADERMLVV